jgi:hypothetical protein
VPYHDRVLGAAGDPLGSRLLSHTLLFLARGEPLFRVDWMLGIGICEDISKQI